MVSKLIEHMLSEHGGIEAIPTCTNSIYISEKISKAILK